MKHTPAYHAARWNREYTLKRRRQLVQLARQMQCWRHVDLEKVKVER